MKVKVLCRNPEDYVRETKKDIFKGKFKLINFIFGFILYFVD